MSKSVSDWTCAEARMEMGMLASVLASVDRQGSHSRSVQDVYVETTLHSRIVFMCRGQVQLAFYT